MNEDDYESNEIREFYREIREFYQPKIEDLTAERDYWQKECKYFREEYLKVLQALAKVTVIPIRDESEEKKDATSL